VKEETKDDRKGRDGLGDGWWRLKKTKQVRAEKVLKPVTPGEYIETN